MLICCPTHNPFLWRTACSYLQRRCFSQAGTMAWHECNPDLVVEQIHPEIDEGLKHQTVGNAQNFCQSSWERGPLSLVVLLRHLGSEANVAPWHPSGHWRVFQARKMLPRARGRLRHSLSSCLQWSEKHSTDLILTTCYTECPCDLPRGLFSRTAAQSRAVWEQCQPLLLSL